MGGAHQGGGRGPPTSIFGPGPTTTGGTRQWGGGGAGQRLTGKVERTIGNLVGSSTLQAKGAQKELEGRRDEASRAASLRGRATRERGASCGASVQLDMVRILIFECETRIALILYDYSLRRAPRELCSRRRRK